ncbi:Hsp20/alpha crystallin family protein [archaeon]|nr:MAG: Hsp20/alpha crystallin family protein [archaeon]
MHSSVMTLLVLFLLALSAVFADVSSSLFGSTGTPDEGAGETSTPAIEKHHIDTPSPLTQLMHYFNHLDQFQLYPNFMTSMAIDIAEGPESYVMHVDLPGVDKGDVMITIDPEQNEMQISALKQQSKEVIDKRYKRIERSTGQMTRTLFLPDKAGIENMTAKFKQGVLEIMIPKITPTSESKRREIPIFAE